MPVSIGVSRPLLRPPHQAPHSINLEMDELAIALPAEDFFGLGSPQSARESLRARGHWTPRRRYRCCLSMTMHPRRRQRRLGLARPLPALARRSRAVRSQSRGRTPVWAGMPLASSPSLNHVASFAGSSSVLAADIRIPQCKDVGFEAPPVARRFRLPSNFLVYRPLPAYEKVAEYELDADDLAWLIELNAGNKPPLLDEDRMEECMDALEKASFKALHGAAQAQRTLYANQPPLPLLSDASQHRAGASTGSPHHGEGGGTGTGRRKEAKRSASYHASPQRSPKAPKAPRSTGRLRRPTAS